MVTIDINCFISPDLQVSEAYETLRSSILFYGNDIKIIGLTCCSQEEEKSVVSLNLAIYLAEVGKKVILIDTDVRKAALSEKFTIDSAERVLCNHLLTINSVEEIIHHTNIGNLDMLLSDRITAISSEIPIKIKLAKLMKELAETYDYVVADIPPLDDPIDGAEVAKVCDGMVLVVKANAVSYKSGRKSKTKLETSGCQVLGAVLLQGA